MNLNEVRNVKHRRRQHRLRRISRHAHEINFEGPRILEYESVGRCPNSTKEKEKRQTEYEKKNSCILYIKSPVHLKRWRISTEGVGLRHLAAITCHLISVLGTVRLGFHWLTFLFRIVCQVEHAHN